MAQWVADLLRPYATKITVANPSQIPRLFRSGRKNDRIDARKLSILSYLDQVPKVHLPPPEVSDWRGLINERRQLVTKRARARIQIRALLRGHALRCPYKSVWTRRGMICLKALKLRQILKARIARLGQERSRKGFVPEPDLREWAVHEFSYARPSVVLMPHELLL